MNNRQHIRWMTIIVSLIALSLACNFVTQLINPAEQESESKQENAPSLITPIAPPAESSSATEPPSPSGGTEGEAPPLEGQGSMALIRQWASEAQASSEYGDPAWSAAQATGEPNTPECGDHQTAWASSTSNTREWINLFYPTPVYATEIHIYQTYNPDQVVMVDLIDMQGNYINVYKGQPQKIENPCPYILSISTASSGVLAQGVRITIDQSIIRLGWNEIDAVELIGVPGEGTPIRPPTP